MNKTLLITATLLFSQAANAADDDKLALGSKLHADNCVSCHDDGVYTRADRKVTSLNALGAQVRRCSANLGLAWFDEDMDAVIHMLNNKHYKF